jgi:glutathione synthase/RimK-type ligase-like ATP-grasp enzyme/ribosomal protein S18 acetylase RimI-like enzyme
MDLRIVRAAATHLQFLEDLEVKSFDKFQRTNRRGISLSLSSPFQAVFLAQCKRGAKRDNVGAAVVHLHKKTVRLYSIAVLPEYRHLKVGKQLLEHVILYAEAKGFEKVSLEALDSNSRLIEWYASFGFETVETLPDYYCQGAGAVRMVLRCRAETVSVSHGNIIVVDNPKKIKLTAPDAEVVSAQHYISAEKYKSLKSVRVFNLCDSYKYQTEGYYVSLLASARDHRVFPSVTTIGDYKNLTFIKSISSELDALIQKTFSANLCTKASVSIFFGQSADGANRVLSSKLYSLFETPLMRVEFIKTKQWQISKVVPLSLDKLAAAEIETLPARIEKFFAKKRLHKPRLKTYKYDLAILVNPSEATPPSCPKALEKFKLAANKCGFYAEFVTKDDYNRISEFDALFIRETTSVNNYTYMFSRLAYAEGLAVIDDPWSILRCSNKIYLHERMLLNKIPVPEARILSKYSTKQSELAALKFPLVLKQPDGSFSNGVSKVSCRAELDNALKILFKNSDLVIAQSFLPSEFDWRIGIIDQQPLFACKYFMAKDHWQIYNWKSPDGEIVGRSVTVALEEVPVYVINTAVRAASLMGDGFYGVDIKEVGGKAYIIEVNDNPNVDHKIEDAVLKDDLYLRIMQSIKNRIEMSRNISRYISADPLPAQYVRKPPGY